jgi:hypothetical protein
VDLQRDFGVGATEGGGDGPHHHVADGLWHRQPQMPARSAAGFAERAADVVRLAQQPVGPGGQHLTFLRRAQGAGRAFDKPHAKMRLKIGDALGQRRLRHPQCQGRSRERSFAQHAAKAAQGGKVEIIVHDCGHTLQE